MWLNSMTSTKKRASKEKVTHGETEKGKMRLRNRERGWKILQKVQTDPLSLWLK